MEPDDLTALPGADLVLAGLRDLEDMLRSTSQAQVDRVTQAFLPMKTLDMAAIRRAYRGA